MLFVFGLVLRLLFVLATPDGGAGSHVGFQGDAGEWQAAARASAEWSAKSPAEQRLLALPLRPPAMQWLVALSWNGDAAHVAAVRLVFLALGAATAPLVWWLLRAHTAPRVAFFAAALCAASSNLLLLSSGLHVEALYLALVLVALLVQQRIDGPAMALAWGALHGALCLVRAEHLLTFVVLAALARASTTWRLLLVGAIAAAAVVAPWQLVANARVDAFNRCEPEGPPELPATTRVWDGASIAWDDDALAAVRALPAFQHRPVFAFVSGTVHTRGRTRVRKVDLDVLHEAYGCFPAPLPHTFVALYGGLNFFLGNTPEADAGFSRAALDREPQLAGGAAAYPPAQLMSPPPGRFAFEYPPHLDAVVHGMSRGFAEIASDPLAAAGRVAKKLWHAAEGATGGVGGYAFPIGLSGTRRQVDLVTATGAWANAWRALVLAVAAAGLWSLRRVRATWPLLAFALTKLLVVAAVFGYARHGALCVPVVALGVAAAVDRFVPNRRWLAPAALGLVLLLEALRCALGAAAIVDGTPLTAPLPAQDFQARAIAFR